MPILVHSPKELALQAINQRKKLKLSQTEVGKLVGLTQKTISALENKPESIQIDTFFRILSALNLDMSLSAKDESIIQKKPWTEEW